jgi:precorrin-6x reductase
MRKILVVWIIGGTAEGRKLAEKLGACDVLLYLSVATEYGKWFLEKKENLRIHSKRMNREEMAAFLREKKIDCVIDASHPYALK